MQTMIQMLRLKIVHHFLHVQQINDMFVDEANHIYIAMPMYNLIEYSDNYSDTSGSLCQFKKDDVPVNDANLTIDNSQSFKYKSALVGKTANAAKNTNSSVKDPKKYLLH